MTAFLVNGVPADKVAVDDRGFQYGDGLFETLLMLDGRAPWWERHMARLEIGCERLGIPFPDMELLRSEAERVGRGRARCAIKVTVTRGVSGRGYLPSDSGVPTRVVAAHPSPIVPSDWYSLGVRTRWCDTRLGINPALAGIKHMNRLEQVLARAEWRDSAIIEGIMRDSDGHVVCATGANLFLVRQGVLITPALERAGVAGVCRAWVMEHASLPIEEREVSNVEVAAAEELFLTSSLRGVLPIRELGSSHFTPGPVARKLLRGLRALGVVGGGQGG